MKLRTTRGKPTNKLIRPESQPNRCWIEKSWLVTVSELGEKSILFMSVEYAIVSKRIPEEGYEGGLEITFWAQSKKIPMEKTTKSYLRKVSFDILESLPLS